MSPSLSLARLVWSLSFFAVSLICFAFQKDDCHRLIPTEGVWKDEVPYWRPNCNFQHEIQRFDTEATQKCMNGRTLYVLGNSVPRQFAFGMVDMLGGGFVKREGQRDMCPKHETFWGDSCHNTFANVSFRFSHLQFMDGFNYSDRGGFPFIKDWSGDKLPGDYNSARVAVGQEGVWDDDFCLHTNVRSCLETFFKGAKKTDVLMFIMGMAYDINNGKIDERAWLRSSASAFRRHITATFPGKVFRVTNSQTLKHVQHMTPSLLEMDQMLWELWRPGSEPDEEQWYTIDQWSINRGRDDLYNDHVHWVGPLTQATLHQVLNLLCPGEGIEEVLQWPRLDLIGKMLVHEDSARGKQYFVADSRGYVFKFSCASIGDEAVPSRPLATHVSEMLVITAEEVVRLGPGGFKDICAEKMLTKSDTDAAVFITESGRRRRIPDQDAFEALGLRFEDVAQLLDWQLSLIPLGASL